MIFVIKGGGFFCLLLWVPLEGGGQGGVGGPTPNRKCHNLFPSSFGGRFLNLQQTSMIRIMSIVTKFTLMTLRCSTGPKTWRLFSTLLRPGLEIKGTRSAFSFPSLTVFELMKWYVEKMKWFFFVLLDQSSFLFKTSFFLIFYWSCLCGLTNHLCRWRTRWGTVWTSLKLRWDQMKASWW